MIKVRDCPQCGGPISFDYVRPDFSFYFDENGKIKRDTNMDLWDGTDPYLDFYCSNDRGHDINQPSLLDESVNSQADWEEVVREHFYEKIFPDL